MVTQTESCRCCEPTTVNGTARYVDQGSNKRLGAFAIYIEPWHANIFEFLVLRKNHGKEEARARDLFYALRILDLLYVFCVYECPVNQL